MQNLPVRKAGPGEGLVFRNREWEDTLRFSKR